MRKRLLGAIAAVAAGAGVAWGQAPGPAGSAAAPTPPAAIGTVGGYAGGVMPAGGMAADPIAPPIGMGGAGVDPGALFPGGMGGGMPYPPPGLHGQQNWQTPFVGADGGAMNGRIAPRMWLNFEYLLWFAQAQPTFFPFVTTSAPAAGGILGNTSTTVLHSNSDLGYNLFSGFRVTTGFFKDDAKRNGWYASGFLTEQKANVFTATSDATGQPLLARPFINAATGLPTVLYASFPTFTAGNVTILSESQTWGAEGGPVVNIYRSCPDENDGPLWNIDMMYGFRYLQLEESLQMQQFTSLLPGNTLPFDGKLYGSPARIEVNDEFRTLNQFYGGQVGLNTELRNGKWYFGVTGKVALGVMHERVDVNGFSILTPGAGPFVPRSVSRGGLFANATNLGRVNNDTFAVIPELTSSLGINWRSWMTTFVGYNLIYVSRVARPGNQYSAQVNPAVVPTSPGYGLGPAVPTPNPLLTQSDFWLQGVNFGVMFRY